ncbi:MAG TPA: YfhO family protein, partial [Bacteroidota bacterium]|nr:YfhO family protein [Bacteroidota bacterium]
ILGTIARSAVYDILSQFMFERADELKQYSHQQIEPLMQKRFDVFWGDFVKSALFAITTLGAIIAYLSGKIRAGLLSVIFLALLFIDLSILDQHYIDPKPKAALGEQVAPDAVIQRIQAEQDTSLFRVYEISDYENNTLMYNHVQAATGYSPAKLKIYQDLRDSCFPRGNMNVFAMLNIKYAVQSKQMQDGSVQRSLQQIPYLPRAWFVDGYKVIGTKKEMFAELNGPSFDPKHVALLEQEPSAKPGKPDSTASVKVTKYESDQIEMTANTSVQALLVLSEIYYPAGWKAYVDGTETEIYKTNYALRSIVVPAGSHKIAFTFHPQTYEMALKVTQAAWVLTGIIIVVGALQLPALKKRMGKGSPEQGDMK